MPWVQLLQDKQLSVNGHPTSYHKGEWVEVGRQTALKWEAARECLITEVQKRKMTNLAGSCGVIVTHNTVAEVKDKFDGIPTITLEASEPALLWEKNIIWDGHAPIRIALIPDALRLLDTWEAAVPLCDYDRLARDEGTEEEQQATTAIIHDLRVMLYDTRLVFLRDCENTRRLIAAWKRERAAGGNERLAFLRALYQTPLLILALPVTWFG